jgi:hypothetical protein
MAIMTPKTAAAESVDKLNIEINAGTADATLTPREQG